MKVSTRVILVGVSAFFVIVANFVPAQSPIVLPGQGTPTRPNPNNTLHPDLKISPKKLEEIDKSIVEMRSEMKTMRARLDNVNKLISELEKGPSFVTEESRFCLARQSLFEDFRAFQAGKKTEVKEIVKSKVDFEKALSAMDLRMMKLGWCK